MKPPKLLAEEAPALDAELGADRLQVANDRVGAKVGQVLGLIGRRRAGDDGSDGRGAARATLIEQEHSKVGEGERQPSRWRARRPQGLETQASLKEDEPRALDAVGRGDLAREDVDGAARGVAVDERNAVLALGEDRARDAVGLAHVDEVPWTGVARQVADAAHGLRAESARSR